MEKGNELQKTAIKIKELVKFLETVNSEPNDYDVEANKQIESNPLYVPISVVERKLDELFYGLYNIDIKEMKVIANEIVLIVKLEIYNPVMKIWLHRDGIGASQIRMRKGSEITDLNGKFKNSLLADAPRAYSEAIKNAAKRFGNAFGRNLNRGEDYNDFATIDEMMLTNEEIQKVEYDIEQMDNTDDLTRYYQELTIEDERYKENLSIMRVLRKRKNEILKK